MMATTDDSLIGALRSLAAATAAAAPPGPPPEWIELRARLARRRAGERRLRLLAAFTGAGLLAGLLVAAAGWVLAGASPGGLVWIVVPVLAVGAGVARDLVGELRGRT